MVNFIGIGAQKCASSWLYEILKQSGEVNLPQIKELDFFSYHYDKGYEWYEKQFEKNAKRFKGEVSPSYFYNSDVPKRVKSYNENIKIILFLRDPIKRMYSNHLHEVRAGHISGENLCFENAFTNNPAYLEQSLYFKHLSKWLSVFPRENILIDFQENVTRSPMDVYVRLAKFLEIDVQTYSTTEKVNESVANRNKILGKSLEYGGSALRKVGMDNVVKNLKNSNILGPIYKNNKVHISETIQPICKDFKIELRKMLRESDRALCDVLKMDKLPWEE